MNVLIIEDEYITAEELAHNLRCADPNINILATLESVEEAVAFLNTKPVLDLVFSDIQLADGLSFEIFEAIKPTCPIIFCTAFDEYAIQAFQANGIDYILKPFDQRKITASVEKFKALKNQLQKGTPPQYLGDSALTERLQHLLTDLRPKTQRKSFLVQHRGKYSPVSINDIAYFYTEHDNVWLVQMNAEKHNVTYKLDEIEQMLDNTQFYRANRQFIVNFAAIKEFEPYFNRKLSVKLKMDLPEPLLVSKEKATSFTQWMER